MFHFATVSKRFLLTICLVGSIQTAEAAPHVPSRMGLADIKLWITKKAQRRIQEKVDSLTKSEKHLQALLYRVNLYMPLVERVLTEEDIPQDFKYQVIQESALISDAFHTSGKSLGFWQFKEPAALESGLKMNFAIDERMHIVAATRGAARYLKSHYQCFDNWLYALLAYNRGRSYVEKLNHKKHRGIKKMRIDDATHWYIIHFLAHKLVFAQKIGQPPLPEFRLYEYPAQGKTLNEVSQVFGVDKEQLKSYNKWLKTEWIPPNTICGVMVPMTHQQHAQNKIAQDNPVLPEHLADCSQYWERAADFPVVSTSRDNQKGVELTLFNGVMGTLAQPGDSLASLAQAGNLPLDQFLVLNDIDQGHQVVPGQVYYYGPKASRAGVHFHVARPGDTWWSVAQQYGIKKKALLLKNRLHKEVVLEPGRVLWLRFIRPAKIPVAYQHEDGNTNSN